ncbi:MAG: flavin reductase family protein [Candidimonas sp.]|jgi:flavin reductase (DIM6/NTAB) family NADH-FMN oxidoreductase RutF
MTAAPGDFDPTYFRSALGRFPTGVTVITTEDPDSLHPIGLTVSSFNSVSLDPPMVLWSLSKTSYSRPGFQKAERYVIHVLSSRQRELAKRFSQGSQADRFAGLSLARAPHGTPMLDDRHSAAWFECFNAAQHEAGDHIIFVGQVERCFRNHYPPLVYHAGDYDLTPAHPGIVDR